MMYVLYNLRSIKLFSTWYLNPPPHPPKKMYSWSAVGWKVKYILCNKLVVKLLTLCHIDYCLHFYQLSNLIKFSPSLAELKKTVFMHINSSQMAKQYI